ncbi:hypothetical protein J6590_082010 [Homalodisca vitripennis]|nr:hypothetical protein J6590_082010 [Homalodisca vitripennis]
MSAAHEQNFAHDTVESALFIKSGLSAAHEQNFAHDTVESVMPSHFFLMYHAVISELGHRPIVVAALPP